jgi:hypothetical protein
MSYNVRHLSYEDITLNSINTTIIYWVLIINGLIKIIFAITKIDYEFY